MKFIFIVAGLFVAFIALEQATFASDIANVKYRGDVSLETFECPQLKHSSFVKKICYDQDEEYLIVRLNDIFYHYCEMPEFTFNEWINSESLGKFYNLHVKGNYDCRLNYMPSYD